MWIFLVMTCLLLLVLPAVTLVLSSRLIVPLLLRLLLGWGGWWLLVLLFSGLVRYCCSSCCWLLLLLLLLNCCCWWCWCCCCCCMYWWCCSCCCWSCWSRFSLANCCSTFIRLLLGAALVLLAVWKTRVSYLVYCDGRNREKNTWRLDAWISGVRMRLTDGYFTLLGEFVGCIHTLGT